MAFSDNGDRTEPATPRKRQEAREQGQVARSQDLTSALILLAICLSLHFLGLPAIRRLGAGIAAGFQQIHDVRLEVSTVVSLMGAWFIVAAQILLPLVVLLLLVAAAANLLQVGFLVSGQHMAPDINRLNPLQGFQRIFSSRGLFRGAFGVLKVSIIGGVLAYTLWNEVASPHKAGAAILLAGTAGQAAVYALDVAVGMCLRAVVAILVLAILDFGIQRLLHDRDLRMTKWELKEEMRNMEGDPKIKERRRRVQQQLVQQRMMRDVPKAHVVVTNPTHLAVALRYERSEMPAPRVVAKGEGHLAERIRKVAMEHDVPIVERRDLARALYQAVEIGQEIPAELYKAVAELLAYVYRLTGRQQAGVPGSRIEAAAGGRR